MTNGFIIRFICVFLWATASLMALDPSKQITQYSAQKWDMEAGLPGNTVYAVQQTPDGYIWLGTQDGLVRFDGITFMWYSRDKFPQVKISEARTLYVDQKGTLWIGDSFEGLIAYKEDEFTTYPATVYKSLSKISAISEDRKGNLWIGSFSEGLTCMNNGKFDAYTTADGLPANEVRAIYKDERKDLWITTEAGIVKMSEPGVFQTKINNSEFPEVMTACLYKEDSKELWFGVVGRYLHRKKNDKYENYGPGHGIPCKTLTCLYEDNKKNLWIGTDGGGLARLNNEGVSSLKPGIDILASGFVYSIFEDKEGSLWVGTLDGGLYRFWDSKFTTFTSREGLVHDDIQCVYEDRAGDIWIAAKGGLNRLKNGKVNGVFTKKQGLLDDSVTSLYEDPTGNLWIGTWGGLNRCRDGKLTAFTAKNNLSDNQVKCIQGDRQGNTWIGTQKGLNRYNSSDGTFTVFKTINGLSDNSIEFIYEDSKGKLWIGTGSGLDYLEKEIISAYPLDSAMGKTIFCCAHEDREGVLWFGTDSGLLRIKEKEKPFIYTIRDGLHGNYIYSLVEDNDGNLWLGGRKGISRVKRQELEALAAGKISRLQPTWYNEKDGMKSSWCKGTAIKTRDNRLWFCTTAGITTIDPTNMKTNLLTPPVIIEKLIVDDTFIDLKEKKFQVLGPGIRRLEFYYTATSFLNPREIKFKIKLVGYDRDWIDRGHIRNTTYTSLSPDDYTFHVIAANSDGVWSREGAAISFKIKPYIWQTTWFRVVMGLLFLLGIYFSYRLKVRRLKAREEELSRLVALRTSDLQQRNLELEKARQNIERSRDLIETKNLQLEAQTVQLKDQSEKLKEMDQVKTRFFTNISHEFRTPLTLIMGPLEQMLSASRDTKEKKNLNLMLRNSQRLLGLINQLLELSKLESGKMKLQAGQRNIISLLRGVTANFEALADTREINLVFCAEEEDITLYVDAGKLEEVVANLLINAFKFTPAGGKISVSVKHKQMEQQNNQKLLWGGGAGSPGQLGGGDFLEKSPPGCQGQDYIEISVSDTGPGIPREQLVHIFDRFYQSENAYENHKKGTGIGLAIVKELVQLHHGKIDVYSHEGRGTEFIISLPLGEAHLQPDEIIRVGAVDAAAAGEDKRIPPGVGFQAADLVDSDETGEETGVGNRVGEDISQPDRDIILVVEDSADVRSYIRGALESNYTIIEAADGLQGIAKAMEIIPDLIISDIMMPGCDGYELCQKLKQDIKTSHIPIILLTAKAAEESILQGLVIGADDYVTKPFSIKILTARIKNLIELRRQMQLNINREMTLRPVEISVSGLDKEFLKQLKEVINKHIADPEFNVEGLARKLYMDRSTVYRKVLALTGEVPTEFIKTCRLKRAAELLKNNYGTILEVALEVGFASANYFTKCFKEKFHCLPSWYAGAARSESSADPLNQNRGNSTGNSD
jgi:signal transduction histidine kinase/ligand-binding sensor domain-containing protein/DNA-binding NarL/FixJ family response regulator